MKKIYSLIAAVLLTATVFLPQQASAQTPEKMSYQAVVRDANNDVVANQSVGMQISILQGSADGNAMYVETQNPTTNTNGLISVEIGMGNTTDDFSAIDWATGPYFIKTETDPTGGSNYTITGTSQLMSVPYALYAKTSGSSIPGPAGTNGVDGTNGTDGTNGVDGAVGATGPQGSAGADGAVGPTGPAGAQGLIGLTGATGTQGAAGNDGAVGATGPAGADGVGIAQTLSQSGNNITLSDGGGSVTITDTDTNLDAAGVTALGFTSGAHTTKYTDAEAVTAVGAHTVDTDTHIDAAGVTALGFTSGAHTVDTKLDAAGVTALGFTSGAHTTKYTDAEAVTAVGAHTVDTDTHLDAAGVTALGFVSGAHTVEVDGSITNEIQDLSSVLTESTDAGGANITNLADPASAQDAATKAYVDLLVTQLDALELRIEALEPPAVVGDFRDGGIVFWVDATGKHGLVVAMSDQSSTLQWYNGSYSITGATSTAIGTGQANTTAIIATQGVGSYAAQICNDLSLDGYSDWFLPSIDEVAEIISNNVVINNALTANAGINMSTTDYWSSTEDSDNTKAHMYSQFWGLFIGGKESLMRVRAIRAF